MAQIKLALRWCRTKPVHELSSTQDGFVECSDLMNYICRDKKITKVRGTEAYNATALTDAIPWVKRAYHKRGDGTFRKVMFAFSGGGIYKGDDVNGTLTVAQPGFYKYSIPLDATMQVSGNSILYFYSGSDIGEIYSYDGNGSNTWIKTTINADIGRVVVGGVVHLDRMWYWTLNSSTITYSTNLFPEDFTTDAADIVVGQETDSTIMSMVVGADETLFIFKNQSIWQLFGRTPATFQFRKVTDKYGLATKRAIYPVAGGFVFLDELSRELCFFGGTEASIKPITEENIRLREILDDTEIDRVCMTTHKGLFRFAFKHVDDNGINTNRELVYPINEPGEDGEPKWSYTKGANIYCYSLWNQQDDKNKLLTGRSDTGKVMYHDRGRNFDGVAIQTNVRTAEIVASEDSVVRFKGFWVKGKPVLGVFGVVCKYYLNGRYSNRGEHALDVTGETRTVGSIKISTQSLLNDRIIPFHNYSLGNSISFEISDNNLTTDMELYSISFTAQPRYKIRNQLVGKS